MAEEREAAEVHLDPLGHVHVERGECTKREDRDHVALERRLPQVEVDVAEHGEARHTAAHPKPTFALGRGEE